MSEHLRGVYGVWNRKGVDTGVTGDMLDTCGNGVGVHGGMKWFAAITHNFRFVCFIRNAMVQSNSNLYPICFALTWNGCLILLLLRGLEELREHFPQFFQMTYLVLGSRNLGQRHLFLYQMCRIPPYLFRLLTVDVGVICTC